MSTDLQDGREKTPAPRDEQEEFTKWTYEVVDTHVFEGVTHKVQRRDNTTGAEEKAAWEAWQARAALAESELAEVREQRDRYMASLERKHKLMDEDAATIAELRAELERVKQENVYVPIPYGWTVKRLQPEDGVAFIINTPRVDGVSQGTAVWSDAENPTEALLALMLDTHPTDIGTEKVLIGYLKPGALEIMQLMPDEWVGGAKLKRDSDSRYTVPVYAAIGAGEGEAG